MRMRCFYIETMGAGYSGVLRLPLALPGFLLYVVQHKKIVSARLVVNGRVEQEGEPCAFDYLAKIQKVPGVEGPEMLRPFVINFDAALINGVVQDAALEIETSEQAVTRVYQIYQGGY